MSERLSLVQLASCGEGAVVQLCREFGICRSTAYKWIARYQQKGLEGLSDRSRRPTHSPSQSSPAMEQLVLELRTRLSWGGRKLRHILVGGLDDAPAASTITDILRRHQMIGAEESAQRQHYIRFEHPRPNDLWQMDFKGHFATACGRCHPLTIVDDHSRFNVLLKACDDQKLLRVQGHLTDCFRRYGLPQRILADNGRPWSGSAGPHTQLTAWLIRLDVPVSHGRPRHPQTQGKNERFNRTLKTELLAGRFFQDCNDVQKHMDPWREVYNHQRPHESLGMATPESRYRPSERAFPEQLPSIEYDDGDIVRKVGSDGAINYRGRSYFVSEAFRGLPIALRPTVLDGLMDIYFCRQKIAQLTLKTENTQ